MAHKHAVIHVVQASYGDALVFEFSGNIINKQATRFMLIDGGPANNERFYAPPEIGRPKHNLFHLLNRLSDDNNAPHQLFTINTLVLTHDDQDHKQGIQTLFASLLQDKDPEEMDDKFNSWIEGDKKLLNKEPPILHIWYNSLKNVGRAQKIAVPINNWFDMQLERYGTQINNPIQFNDELAVNRADTNVTLAMANSVSKSGQPVEKSQFTFDFIGPDWKTLKKDRLRQILGQADSLKEPAYVFTQQMAQKTDELSSKTLHMLESLAWVRNLKKTKDTSLKNQSSIAFAAEDGNSKILLLGDAVAQIFWDRYQANNFVKFGQYTIMKIMHHGSYHNNFWSTTPARKAEEHLIPDIAKMDMFLKSVTFFFAKVPAKKYIISASSFDMHPNPHISTLIGIISAARENNIQVDIYLTNHLAPWVVQALGDWYFAGTTAQVIPNANFWLLADHSHHGTIAIYDHEDDSTDWVKAEVKDMWSSYPSLLISQNKTIADLVAAADNTANVQPKKKQKLSPSNLTLFELSGRVMEMSADAIPTFSSTTPQPVVGAEHRSPGSRHVSSSLTGTSAHMDHSELSAHEWIDTITLPDFASTLKYLIDHGSIDGSKSGAIERELTHSGGLKLGPLVLFFMGTKESEKLLASLPCNLNNGPQYLNDPNSPYFWVATDFSAKVVDGSKRRDMVGWNGLYSITFNAKLSNPNVTWTLPLNDGKVTHHFTVDRSLNFVVLWPRYVKGISSVAFKGQLSTTTKSYHAIGELTVMSDQNPKYRMKLSTPDYDADQYQIPLLDLALIFDTQVDFASSLGKILIPGLQSALDSVVDTSVHGAGFTLERILSKVIVRELFAEKSIAELTEKWNPFTSSHFILHPDVLHVVVGDAYSESSRQISVHLDGDMKINLSSTGLDPEIIPFRLSAQYTVNQFMLYEISLYPGTDDTLSISHLLDILGVSSALDLQSSFPGVSNLSNALSISHVSVGWLGSVTPEYLKFTISLDDWVISKNLVEVTTIQVDVEVSSLSSKSPKHLVLRGWGVITISGIQVECFFNFIKNDQESGKDLISIQIASQQRPISLGSIVSQFLGENTQILPQNLSSLLQETTLDRLVIQGERDHGDRSSGWTVTKIQVAMSIQAQINVFSDVQLGYPTLMLEVTHPFDQKARSIYVGINTSIVIGEIICSAEIVVASAVDSVLSMSLQSGDRPLSIEALVAHFIPDYGNVNLPAGLSFLAGIGIQGTSVTLEISKGKFSMTELSISAISTSSLKLWNEITLQNICLHFSKSQYANEVKVEFDAMLLFNKADNEFLDVTLLYGGPTVTTTPAEDTDQERTLVAPIGNKGSWSAHAAYEGRLSAIEVLSSLSGIDLRHALVELNIPAFTNTVNLVITGLQVNLNHSAESSSFLLDAKTEWLCFSHLRFSCSKAAQWTYSFGFDISTGADDGPIIPFMDKIKKVISLEDMSVAVFNGNLDVTALRPSYAKLPPQKARGVSLAVAARFILGKELKKIGEIINTPEVYVIGLVSKDSFLLSATLTGNLSLFNKCMTITDLSAIVECRSENDWLPTIGVRGSGILDFGKDISENPIEESVAIFIKTIDFGLGFEIKVKSWRSMFGIHGMDFENVVLEAAFPPEQFPVPSEFTIAGKVKLHVNNAKIDGEVNVHVIEEDLTSSYAKGSISGLYLSNIIGVFTDIDFGPPGYLDSGFGPLVFIIVPKDMRDYNGDPLKQQFKMSGSMQLPIIHFKADIDIDITSERLHVDGHLSPITIPYVPEKLFSILASPHEDGVSTGGPKGASIYIHIGDKDKLVDASVSGMISFLGMSNEVDITINETGLKFLLAQDVWTKRGSFNGELNSTRLKVHADYEFTLDIVMPNFSLDGIKFNTIHIFNFAAKLDVEVVWQNVAWNLVITGHFELFSLRFDKTLSVGADFQDLAAIGNKIASVIKSTFGTDLVAGLKRLGDDISKALHVLKDFGLSVANCVKVLVDSCGEALTSVLESAKQVFGLVWDEMGVVLRDMGKTAEEAVKVLKNVGLKAYGVATAIGKAFGNAARSLCATILQEGGHVVGEIAHFFRSLFDDGAHDVVDILTGVGYGSFDIVSGVMGVFKSSAEEIFRLVVGVKRRKSQKQLQEQLLLLLMIRANDLLSQRVAIASKNDLEEIISQQAKERFRHMFGYDFEGQNSKPISCINSKTIKGGSFKAVYEDGQKSHVLEQANTMFSGLNLDSWMMSKAKKDVTDEIDVFLGLIPANDWKASVISIGYLPEDTNKNPIHVDGVIIFANGALAEYDQHVTETILFYISVFYEVLPETKVVKHNLSLGAYEAAPLLNEAVRTKIPTDDDSLSGVLHLQAAELFKKQLGTSDQWATPAVSGSQGSVISSLARFEDGNSKMLDVFIATNINGKMLLPSWTAGTLATDLASDFRAIIASLSLESWNVTKIDTVYPPPQPMLNPVASKAVLIWYKAQQTTSQNVKISLVYIYFYGVYYAVANPRSVLRNDLVNLLSLNLIKLMNEEYSEVDTSLENMKIYAEQYAREEFYKACGYDFLDEYSTPNDRHGEEPMHTVRLFQEFQDAPLAKDLNEWVDKVIKLDAFPLFKQEPSIREDFLTQIQYLTEGGIGSSPNTWTLIPFEKRYNYPANANRNIRSSGIIVYTNGKLTAQDDTVDISFVSYMGVFYVGDSVDW